MQQVTTDKMLALSEGAGIPNPNLMQNEGPRWLYSLPWWGPGNKNPAPWVKKVLNHDLIVTLDELPTLGTSNNDDTGR